MSLQILARLKNENKYSETISILVNFQNLKVLKMKILFSYEKGDLIFLISLKVID